MGDAIAEGAGADACELCQEPLAEGETVVQIVEDRHSTYDREVVLHTYHRRCCRRREIIAHECTACDAFFHLALLRQGESGRNPAQKLFCPFCGMPFEHPFES